MGAFVTVYRGESIYNRNGNFWTESKEFARQFTQTGQAKEVLVRYIASIDIYIATHVYAGNEEGVDAAIAQAKNDECKAVMLNEGRGEPNSIFVFDKTCLRRNKPI